MAAINFEELTILNGFIDFNEDPDVLVIDGSAEAGLHLVAQGYGDQIWCDYGHKEWFLKFGRIALMKVGESWIVNHGNWYGSHQEVTLKSIERYDDGRTFLNLEWTKIIEREEDSEEINITVIISLTNKEVSDYMVKHNFLHYFVYEIEMLEYNFINEIRRAKRFKNLNFDDLEIEVIEEFDDELEIIEE